MLILPLSLIASLFLGDVVGLVYGAAFRDVALLFPFLVIAHAVAVIITPAGSIPMLKHEMKKSMVFNIATAAVNIALDLYLITKYQAFGAMLSNVVSQFFSIGLSMINIKKYRLDIFNKYMVRVFFMNMLMGALFFAAAQYNLEIRLIVALLASVIYIALMLKTAFNQQDVAILKNLQTSVPRALHPLFNRCIKIIQKRHTAS
jgi:O-antigen/teichoic acid export membrane protein